VSSTVRVDGGGARLREALAAVADGTIIELAPGRYEGPVVVRSSVEIHGTPGETIIAVDDEGAVLVVEGRRHRVLLAGLTLTGGRSRGGGGLKVPDGAWLTVRDCVVDDCDGGRLGGGGLYARRGELLLERVRFVTNRGRQGGAALLDGDVKATFVDCAFQGNEAVSGGALAARDRAQVLLRRCAFTGNHIGGDLTARGAAIDVDLSPRASEPVSVLLCAVDGGIEAVAGRDDGADLRVVAG
jgi:hypothetical protein